MASEVSHSNEVVTGKMIAEKDSSYSKEVVTGKTIAEKAASALLVDDDPISRKINTMLLSKFGFITLTAENGRQAVELCQSGAHFNLIIMDLEMPLMDGIEATQILRAMGVNCKILGMTANQDDSIEETFIEAGADCFFYKPLNADKLTSTLMNM